MTNALKFPTNFPKSYQEIADELIYDSEKHLSPELPDRIWTLEEFGYSQEEIAAFASNVAVTSPFRLLSDEGVNALHTIAARLKSQCTKLTGKRVPNHLAGGVYRSKFLRDLCACPLICEHLSKISGTELAPHTMPSQQLYVNYAPEDISKAVDSWHYDGIGFDYVLLVSDPKLLKGGNFEYFMGTRQEIAKMFGLKVHEVRYGITEPLPKNRVIKVKFPAAGYAIFQQGNLVVHRAAKLKEPAERITVVPGYVSENISVLDPTAKHDMIGYAEPGIVTELGRHSAWLAREKLTELIETLPFSSDVDEVSNALENAVTDVTTTIDLVRKR